jgi:NADH-quinone oxidoreductase subunit A
VSELVLLAVAVAVLALAAVGAWLALRIASSPVVVLPFESGSLVTQHAVSRYHVRWYAVTLLFLAFDMEMVFMYPWALVVAEVGPAAVVEMFGVLAVLVLGVVYCWREGALRWT